MEWPITVLRWISAFASALTPFSIHLLPHLLLLLVFLIFAFASFSSSHSHLSLHTMTLLSESIEPKSSTLTPFSINLCPTAILLHIFLHLHLSHRLSLTCLSNDTAVFIAMHWLIKTRSYDIYDISILLQFVLIFIFLRFQAIKSPTFQIDWSVESPEVDIHLFRIERACKPRSNASLKLRVT